MISSRLDLIFSALSDPTRRAMLSQLTQGECSISELAEPFQISLPAVSKHIKVLEQAGLLCRRIEGRVHWCRLVSGPMQEAMQCLEKYQKLEKFEPLVPYLSERECIAEKEQ